MRKALLANAALLLCACMKQQERVEGFELAGGNWRTGRDKIQYYGCGSCHTIPGVDGAHGLIGPPLTRFAKRMYIGGVLQNTPENLQTWIRDPLKQSINLQPCLGCSSPRPTPRDMTTYLYTLE
jgi:cytochrome c1